MGELLDGWMAHWLDGLLDAKGHASRIRGR